MHKKHGGFSHFVQGVKSRAARAGHAVGHAAHVAVKRGSTVLHRPSHGSRPSSGTGLKPDPEK